MGRPPLDQREIESFREELSAAAIRLFAEDGFDAVTTRAIADEVGASPAKMYTYVDGKEEILAAARAKCFSDFTEFVEGRIEGIEDPEEVLLVQGRTYLEYAKRRPNAFKIMFTLDRASAEDFPEIRNSIQRSWNLVRSAVEDAVDAGVLAGDVNQIADLLWSGIHGIATLELAGTPGPDWEPDPLVESMFRSLIEGHRPDDD